MRIFGSWRGCALKGRRLRGLALLVMLGMAYLIAALQPLH